VSPRSTDLRARDARALWHPYTRHGLDADPLPVVAARGAELTLADGRVLVDAISSWWTCLHGHGHPRLLEAMARQAERLDHVLFAGATHEPAVALAEALLEVAPRQRPGGGGDGDPRPPLSRVFYSDDGSTAVEVALKMAWLACAHRGEPERTGFVALDGAYHGDTFGAMALGDPAPFFEDLAPLLFPVRRVPPSALALERLLDEVGGTTAAVVLEPLVQGAAGMRMHPPALVQAARRLCDRHGAFLVADEVMTGFGRTGTLFACERAGVAPDLLCLAKGLTGGMLPLAATLATEAVFEAFAAGTPPRFFPHGHTFTANPIACAVAKASLDLALETEVPARFEALGAGLEARLAPLADDPRVRGLRRTGGIVALDLADPEGYASTATLRRRAVALEHGALLRPLGSTLYAMPPACTSDAQLDRIAAALAAQVGAEPGPSRAR